MNPYARASTVAAALVAAFLCASPLSPQSVAKKRTPPAKSDSAPQARKPPAPPPTRTPPPSQTRKPPAPPARAVPRSQAPKPTPPHTPPPSQTYVYPFVPFVDFDFFYRFPYGSYPHYGYPYSYPYPYPPYRFVFPPPGCVATELETHGILRIDVPQRDAMVLVDGFYAGIVDDFNGLTGHLNLTPGPHHLELRAPGFTPVTFDVNITAGETVTYRTPLQPAGSSATPQP